MKLNKAMTTGSEWKQILFFSLPIMAGNILQQLYNTVDGIVVGNYVSEGALAAVGTSDVLNMVFMSLAIGLGSGSSIMISQLFGAQRMNDLKKAVSTALITQLVLGIVLSLSASFGARFLLGTVLGVKDTELLEMAVSYFRIIAMGLVFQFMYNSIAAVLRAVGDSRPTLYFLMVASVMNVGLDLLFVVSFGMGVAGAALATIIAQFVSMVVSAIYMTRKYEMFRFKRGEFVFDISKAKMNLRLGIPTTLQQLVMSFGNIFMQRLVNSFGQTTMAAFTVGQRIESYLFVTIFGFGIGMSTFSGQNMGAGKIDRIKKGWRSTVFMSGGITIALSTVIYIFAGQVSGLFGVGGEAMARSVEFVRYMSFFFVLFSFYNVTAATLQGTGDVLYAALCTMSTLFTRVCLAYVFAYVLDMGYPSIWRPIPIGWAIASTFAVLRYASGKWKTKGIISDLPADTASVAVSSGEGTRDGDSPE